MHAIRNVADGHFILRFAGNETGPHGARYFSVQGGNRVGVTGEPKPEHCHAEGFLQIAWLLASQSHQAFLGKTKCIAQRPKMFFHQIGIEAIVACGNRCMGSKNHFPRHPWHRCIEANSFLLHAHAQRFEHGKSAVTFIQMKNSGRDAHGLQRTETADT